MQERHRAQTPSPTTKYQNHSSSNMEKKPQKRDSHSVSHGVLCTRANKQGTGERKTRAAKLVRTHLMQETNRKGYRARNINVGHYSYLGKDQGYWSNPIGNHGYVRDPGVAGLEKIGINQ